MLGFKIFGDQIRCMDPFAEVELMVVFIDTAIMGHFI